LSAREAAVLAAVLPNPRRYNPLGSSKYVRNRSERIYRIMVRRGIIIPEYEAVMKEPEEAPVEDPAVPESPAERPTGTENPVDEVKEQPSEEVNQAGEGKTEPSGAAEGLEKPEA